MHAQKPAAAVLLLRDVRPAPTRSQSAPLRQQESGCTIDV